MASRNREDYLEAIYGLIRSNGHARTKDIAAELNVKSPSVTGMLSKLDRDGFVNYEKYSGIWLTKKGKERALDIKRRHETFKRFLVSIGVPERIAEKDACTMEHSLHKKTIEQMKKLVER